MDDISQQIAQIEEELRTIPHHKGTNHYIGKMRARISRLKDKRVESEIKSKGGGGSGGYAVRKHGDASVVLIGPPSCGKSTLINRLTNAESKVAAYAFTTLSVIPGMLLYNDAYIQIFDVPGLLEGAGQGKGRGKEVLSVARNSDLLLIMTDPNRMQFLEILVKELGDVGIRINQTKPNVLIEKKTVGGLEIHSNIKQDYDKETVIEIASEMGIKNADITIKEKLSIDRLIDAFSPNRLYLPALFVVNKVDQANRNLKLNYELLKISAEKNIGLDTLIKQIWISLELIKVYLVGPDDKPNFGSPIIMHTGDDLKTVADKIGSDFSAEKKLAKIWGQYAQFAGQEVPLTTKVKEGMQVRFI